MEEVSIYECQNYAQEHGFDSVEFTFTNLRGEVIKCKWLDAYMGLLIINGSDGFITVDKWQSIVGELGFKYTIL